MGADGQAGPRPPSAGGLLPPTGLLLPPSSAPRAGTGPAGPSAAEERARALARQLRETAAAHAPELKRRAGLAAGVAAVGASRAARKLASRTAAASSRIESEWSASRQVPGRRRRIALGAAAVLLLLAGAAWLMARQQATATARLRMVAALERTGLRGVVFYRAVSASPFGTVTLSDVTLRLGPITLPIASVRLAGLGDEAFSRGRIAVHGAVVPILAVARSGVLGRWPEALLGLGVVSTTLDGSAGLATDATAETLVLTASLDATRIGRAHAIMRLGGLAPAQIGELVRLLRAMQMERTMAYRYGDLQDTGLRLQSLLSGVSWQGGSLDLDDSRLRPRVAAVTALSVPDEAGDPGLLGPPGRLPRDALSRIVPPDQDEAAQAALQGWLDHGGHLAIRSDPPSPVALFQRGGMALGMPGLDAEMLAAAGISLGD